MNEKPVKYELELEYCRGKHPPAINRELIDESVPPQIQNQSISVLVSETSKTRPQIMAEKSTFLVMKKNQRIRSRC